MIKHYLSKTAIEEFCKKLPVIKVNSSYFRPMGLGINLRITHFLSGIVLREQNPITPPNEEHEDMEGLREHDRQSECTWLSLLLSLESCWHLPGSLDPLAASSTPDVTVELGPGLEPGRWWCLAPVPEEEEDD